MPKNMKSAKMGTMPVAKLLITMSLPAMLSMLVQALYNVVDSIFIGQYDAGSALTAINLAMPFQMIALAFALGVGVGTNAIVSKSLGEQNHNKASNCAQTGAILGIFCYVLFIFVGLFLSGVYAHAFSEGNQEVELLTTQYLSIVVTLSLFNFIEAILNKILQATGNMIVPMISQLIGAVINIILDPFFINGYFFFPELGIRGAAVATVIGQACAAIFVVSMFVFKKQDVSLNFKGFRFHAQNVRQILVVGIPTTILNGLTSLTTILMYAILENLVAKTVLGLYFKVQSFVFMPVFGLNQGAMPIMSYNYGSGDKQRFNATYRLSVAIAGGILLLGMVVFLSIPSALLALFNVTEGEGVRLGSLAFRMIALSFIPAAFGILNITKLQSTQNGFFAMIIAICRQLIFLVPTAFIIKLVLGTVYLDFVWLCYPISEVLALIISFYFSITRSNKAFAGRTRVSMPTESEV